MTMTGISALALEKAIDVSLLTDLGKRVIEIASPTGEEESFANFLVETMQDYGMDGRLQTIYEGRHNAYGHLGGERQGVRVLWSGHMDTSVRGDEPWLTGVGWKNVPVVEDGVIWGNGIRNMKSAFVAYFVAVDAMKRLGIKLPGELVIAGTAGEIEMSAVDEFTGRDFDSVGMGLRHLLIHGVAADYHLLGEPTGLVPYLGNPGTVWAKVSVDGTFSHTAFSDHGVHAIEEMWKLWRGLDSWIAQFQKENEHRGVKPQINRSAIRGGMPWRAARTPPSCSMYIDIRLPPHRFPIDVQREFELAVHSIAADELGAPVAVDWYLSRPGTMISESHPLASHVQDARTEVLGFEEQAVPYICVCSDAMDANRLGIPTLQFGVGRAPGEKTRTTGRGDLRAPRGEFARVDDIVSMAQIFTLATASLMGQGVPAMRASRYDMPTGAS